MKLTAQVATDYGKLKANLKAMEEEAERLGKEIKREMAIRRIDEFAPEGSPYKLVKTEYEQTDVDYKHLAMDAYRDLYGKAWKAKFDKDVESSGKKPIVKLEAKPNENWIEPEKLAV